MATIRENLIESSEYLAKRVNDAADKNWNIKAVTHIIDTLRNIPEYNVNNLDMQGTYDPLSGTLHCTYDYQVGFDLYVNAMVLYGNGGHITTREYEEVFDRLKSEHIFKKLDRVSKHKYNNIVSKLSVLTKVGLATYEKKLDDDNKYYTVYEATENLEPFINGTYKVPLMYATRDRNVVETSSKYLVNINDIIYGKYKCITKELPDDREYVDAREDADKIGKPYIHLNDRIFEISNSYYKSYISIKVLAKVCKSSDLSISEYDLETIISNTIAEFGESSLGINNPDKVIKMIMSNYNIRFIKEENKYKILLDKEYNPMLKPNELSNWVKNSGLSRWSSSLLLPENNFFIRASEDFIYDEITPDKSTYVVSILKSIEY